MKRAGRWLLVAMVMAGPVSAGSPGVSYAGRPLAEALQSLQRQGLTLVFTSELVRPDMKVVREPAAREPRRVLDEILAPHGLAVEEGPGGVLVVVARTVDAVRKRAIEEEVAVRERLVFHDEIVVQPSRLSLLQEKPDSSLSLDREEIESLPHLGGDVFRATSLLPGVAANDVTAQFSVHGGRRDEVQILLDGQELYDAYHLKDYDNALSLVPARALAGVSLTTGAWPASRGDRMSGVLDLRTMDPPAGRRYTLGLSVLDALALSSGRFAGDRGAWLATVRRGSLDLAGRMIGKEDPSFWDALGKMEIATGFGLVGVRVLAAGDELELDKEASGEFERFENTYRNRYGWLTHQASGKRLLVETSGSWAEIERRRGGAASEEDGGFELRDRRDFEALGLAQTWSLQLEPRHTLQWGWERRHYDAFLDYAKDLEPDLVILAPFAPPRATVHRFEGSLRGEHGGVWVSDRISALDRLTAEVGARYDRHTATGDHLLSPRINLAWRPGERSVLRAGWGRFFQSQRPYELQIDDGEQALRPAELSEHWVLGWETLPQPGRLGVEAVRVELFRREIEDPRPRYENLLEPLNFFPEIEPDRVRIAPEESLAQGIEVLVRGRRGARFDWWLAWSWARAEDRLADQTVPRALDQPHTAALALDWRLPREWSLNLAWRYHTGWPVTPVEARLLPDPEDPEEEPELAAVFGPLNRERLSAYHRLDLRASRRWDLRSGGLTFFVDVQNLYDRRNLAGFDVELDEEAGAVRLREEHWPGIFPSLGITWDF